VTGNRADIAGDVIEGVGEPTRRLAWDAELRLTIREQHGGCGEAGTDQKRLRDRGVFDLVGVGARAETGQIEVEDG
jgi:hypothetical protein